MRRWEQKLDNLQQRISIETIAMISKILMGSLSFAWEILGKLCHPQIIQG